MIRTLSIAIALAGLISGPVAAACASRAPQHNWNHHTADQKVTGDWLKGFLVGKKVTATVGGTETYYQNGKYRYKNTKGTWDAPAYMFYSNGVRCIDYPNQPRYDKYVVVNKGLVLINWSGGRYESKVWK